MKLSRPEAQENYFLICSSLAPVYTLQPQFYIQLISKLLCALHSLSKFEWKPILKQNKIQNCKKRYERDIMQLLSGDTLKFFKNPTKT